MRLVGQDKERLGSEAIIFAERDFKSSRDSRLRLTQEIHHHGEGDGGVQEAARKQNVDWEGSPRGP